MITSFIASIIFVLILLVILLILQNISLTAELRKKKDAKIYYENKKKNETEAKNKTISELYRTPSSFYTLKNSCINSNESLMYYYLNTELTRLISNAAARRNYYIFPQVSLYSLISIRPEINSSAYDIAKSHYIAKSIDFVICYCHKVGMHYDYKPVLLIELDGPSHHSPASYGTDSFYRQQSSDAFKDSLFNDLNIPFCRFKINKYLSRSDIPEIQRMLREKLTLEY